MKNEITGISVTRAIAALLIVNYHTKRLQIPILENFAIGGFILNIIFVGLSGYLLMIRYEDRQIDKSWYKRRFLRIFPPYWLSLVIILVIILGFNLPNEISVIDLPISITGLQYLVNINTMGEHLWFVTLIIVCYLLFDLTRNLLLKYRYKFILSLIIGLLAIATIHYNPETGFFLSAQYHDLHLRISASPILRLIFHYLAFVLAMFVAHHAKDSVRLNSRKRLLWAMIFGISFVGYSLLSRLADTGLLSFLVISLAFVSSYSFVILFGNWNMNSPHLVNRFLKFISSISYEIYLIHFVFVALFQKYLFGRFIAYPLVFVLSILSAYLINLISTKLTTKAIQPRDV